MVEQRGRWIDRIWRISLVLVVLSQVFFLAIRTRTGARVLPAMLVKMGFMRQRQVGYLLKTMRPDNQGVVKALTSEINNIVPSDSQLEVVWSGTPLIVEVAELNYALYPRPLSQRTGFPGDRPDAGCRIDWSSETDVTLTCPGSVWKYGTNGVVQK